MRSRLIVYGLVGVALLLGPALFSSGAQARSQVVCCFRLTVEVSGEVHSRYRKVDPTADEGVYDYRWEGTAYGIAHLKSSVLRTDRAVAAGYLLEETQVTDGSGQPRDRHDPGCPAANGNLGIQSGRLPLGKTRYSFPQIGLGVGGLAFGSPFEHWELNCGSLATDALDDLQAGNHAWNAPRQFFFNTNVRGLSARKLAMRRSQQVTCVEKSNGGNDPRMDSSGLYTVLIKLVPFPASDLKHQQGRLTNFLGKFINWDRRPVSRLHDNFFAGRHTPTNGCHPG